MQPINLSSDSIFLVLLQNMFTWCNHLIWATVWVTHSHMYCSVMHLEQVLCTTFEHFCSPMCAFSIGHNWPIFRCTCTMTKKGLFYYIGKRVDFYCESVVDQEELYRSRECLCPDFTLQTMWSCLIHSGAQTVLWGNGKLQGFIFVALSQCWQLSDFLFLFIVTSTC